MNPKDPQPRNPSLPAEELHPSPAKYEGKPLPNFILKNTISLETQARKYKDRSVYVFNNSKAVVGTAMKLALPIITGDQSEKLIALPATWLPQNLSEHVAPEDIFRSSHLRTALMRKTLLVVNPDYAEDMLLTPMAIIETDRINAASSNNLSDYGDILDGKDKPIVRNEPEKPSVPADIKQVEGIRAELVVAVNARNMPALASILSLAQVNEDLTEAEAAYVRSQISDKTVLETLAETPVTHVTQ